jgi:cytochrome oxidase Cu insertion factor (SCO1/SenC/PrrC family)
MYALIPSFYALIPSFATVTGTAPASHQANSPAMVNVETVGPKVGEALPDFSLPDQQGQQRSLKSVLASKGAVIVFFRSADW